MNFGTVLSCSFISIWSLALFSNNQVLVDMLLINAAVQIALFLCVACIPYLLTDRMSYVDIAWPFGVAVIGILIILLGDGDFLRRVVVGGVYLMIGLRMGVGALTMAKTTGVIFKTEFPRYVYRRMVLENTSKHHIKYHSLAEMMAQGFANISVLAFPGFLIALNDSNSISILEILGMVVWLLAYIMESTADTQKLLFISKNSGGVCDIGLWRYSRHPNYFSEWLVWTGVVLAAIPSWIALSEIEQTYTWLLLGIGSIGASVMMYITLIYLTGAIPSEYYSIRKRPEYKAYQKRTNMFFPGRPKQNKT